MSDKKLPHGWIQCSIIDFSELIMGQSPPSSTYNTEKNGLPFYQGKTEFGKLYPTPEKYCSKPNKITEKGDVLISVRAPVGPTNISPHKACIGRGLAAIRALDNIPTKFILYLFRSYEPSISSRGTGTTFKAITKKSLESLSFPLPPLPEQHRIVAKIEELFSDLDKGIENLKKAQEQLKLYRQAVLKHAFEGKLTQQWRKQNAEKLEPAEKLLEQIKEERKKHREKQLDAWRQEVKQWEESGKKGRKPRKPRKPTELPPLTEEELADLPELPEGWGWVKISFITKNIQYGYTQSSSQKIIGPKFLRITDIQNNKVNWGKVPYCKIEDHKKQKYLLEKGDILFARTGATVGKSFLVKDNIPESIFASYLIRLQLFEDIERAYIFNYFQSSRYWKQITEGKVGVGQPNVNGTKLSKLRIPLCPQKEQHQIVAEIESRLSVCDKLEETIEESLKKAELLRQSILKKAFEGKLVPQDPEDEPAEKLLERIKKSEPQRVAD
jgi:type I restriction enzyme S subunit